MTKLYRLLLRHSVGAWTAWNRQSEGIDLAIDRYIEDHKLDIAILVRAVVDGVSRRICVLDIFVEALLVKEAARVVREDKDWYLVIAWVVFFANHVEFYHPDPAHSPVDSLISFIRGFVLAAGSARLPAMHALLDFAFSDALNGSDLSDWVLQRWEGQLDGKWVESNVLNRLRNVRGELQLLLDEVRRLAQGGIKENSEKIDKRPSTNFKPFRLSVPIKRQVDRSTPTTRPAVSAALVPAPLIPAPTPPAPTVLEPFKLLSIQRGEAARARFGARARLLSERINAECTFQPKRSTSPIAFPDCAPPIRLTAAAILREHKLQVEKESAENAELDRLLTEGRDGSLFSEWQRTQISADLKAQQQERAKIREDLRLSRERAAVALEAAKGRKALKAVKMKRWFNQKQLTVAKAAAEEKERLKEEARKIREAEFLAAQTAVSSVLEVHSKKGAEIRGERKLWREHVKKTAAEELAEKRDLIMRIRAVETVSLVNPKPFDPTEPPVHADLFGAMSLAELKDRLAFVTERRKKEEEAKRESLLHAKRQRVEQLEAIAQSISVHRAHRKRQIESKHATRIEQNKQNMFEIQKAHEEAVLRGARELEEKRHKAQEQLSNVKRISLKVAEQRKSLVKNKSGFMAKAGWDILKGMERKIEIDQCKRLIAEKTKNKVEISEAIIRQKQLKLRVSKHFGS